MLGINQRTVAATPRSEAEYLHGVPQIVVEKDGCAVVSIM
jgi:hypothetical protein